MVSAPIQTGKGPRGAARWRRGGGPWCYGKPPKVFTPAPKELQHAWSATRIRQPVYAAHKPINASEIKAVSAREGEAKLVHIKGERSKHDDAALYYTHHGDVVMNGVLRGRAKHQEARLTREWEEERARLSDATKDVVVHLNGQVDQLRQRGLHAQADEISHQLKTGTHPQVDAAWTALEQHESRAHTLVDVRASVKPSVRALDEFIGARTLSTDASLFRGGAFPAEMVAALKPGATFVDRGYPSTTIDSMAAMRFARVKDAGGQPVLFHIRARKGQSAAYMEPYTQYPGESEVLLPRGTKFRVVEHRVPDAQWMPHTIVVEIE